ncbi:SMC-Scp complex subunit ScpB [Priestia abyssalis]|uniref:SMC-Scp complex subunit ScpB n=1 Tax=Priestia abyssalis TaxID=1221450 RepID=UPI0009957959|nr:SMC-Scp complex subunit ScpB [Priestia abyssalis]
MNMTNYKSVIESLLFVAGDEGLSLAQICDALAIQKEEAKQIIGEMHKDFKEENRGIEIIEIAGTYQLATKKENVEYVKRLVDTPSTQSLSQAALETLAIVAYRQPITRVEIEEVRGVKTERPIQTLVAKALIKEVGRADGAGRAILYGTTKEFLSYFGLKTIQELPVLSNPLETEPNEQEADLFFEKFQEVFE